MTDTIDLDALEAELDLDPLIDEHVLRELLRMARENQRLLEKSNQQAEALRKERAELTTLRAANAAMAKDAARYRWLRKNSGHTIRCELFGEAGMREHNDHQLDELIDASIDAIAQQGEKP